MTRALSIRLMILSGPPQRGQIKGSASYTFLMSRAQERRIWRAKSSAQPGCRACASGASGSLPGAAPERSAPARRTFENAPQYRTNCCPALGIWVHRAARKSRAGMICAAQASVHL